MQPKTQFILMFLLSLAAAAASLVLDHGKSAEQREQDNYCAMVEMYKHDPSTGWPDFHHTYDSECPNGKSSTR